MKTIMGSAAVLGTLLVLQGPLADARSVPSEPSSAALAALPGTGDDLPAAANGLAVPIPEGVHATEDIPAEALTGVVRRVCAACHNDRLRTGNLSLQTFDVALAPEQAEIAEKMIRKLRAGMMPPPGMPRPGGDTMLALVETIERVMDAAAVENPNPGARPFQRLNQAEYAVSIRDVLGMEIDPEQYLPLDTKSANFDNIADVQMLSPTLLDAFLNAAAEISRIAIGDANATPSETTYEKSGYNSQWERVPGAPFGTRGGISEVHNFPADGEYVFKFAFDHTTTGGFTGGTIRDEVLELSLDGEPYATLHVDQWMHVQDPNQVNMSTDPIFVRAGPHRVTAAFVDQFEGPVEDLMSPHEWSLTDRQVGDGGYGVTILPHLKELVIGGPYNATGVSETPIRERIFSCRPTTTEEARPCAREIVTRLATDAYRRPVTDMDVDPLMAFYDRGEAEGGFEAGVRVALQAILASPDFVFRFERPAERVRDGESYRINDQALASRLSFFLWGTPPDDQLQQLAAQGKLGSVEQLEEQARRMLADPRAEALGTRFAAQWLRLQDLEKVHPDGFWYPDFDQQLANAMRRETELFFYNLVTQDRSFLDLFTADYTFVNERLARHYGFEGVVGNDFQRVTYPDDTRRGLLGHGSVLVLTSHANRTSPVLRGKWVMEVLLGTPPPPPPPGIPALEETAGAKDGVLLTTRERMEMHRASPVCSSCHQFMDPIGLSLDNFDLTGKWRIRENGAPLDTRGTFYDGTPVSTPAELRTVLLKRPEPLLRTFTNNLMAYALGRRVEYYDQPVVRSIVREAAANDYRMSSFILGVIRSDAFRMQQATVVAEAPENQ